MQFPLQVNSFIGLRWAKDFTPHLLVYSGLLGLLHLLHKLHKGLLVDEAGVLAIAEHAHVAQAEFREALVYEVNRGMDIQSHRCLNVQYISKKEG